MKTIRDLDVKNKTIILRANFDVPIKSGKILDDSRIIENIPTIKYLITSKAKVLIISHLGRPQGKDKKLSLKPIAKYLEKSLHTHVKFLPDILDANVISEVSGLEPGKIIIFENIRFYEEESKNNFKFAKEIAKLGDYYVNEAFAVAHRAHASIDAITKYIPSFCGFSFEKEVEELSKVKDNPRHPFVVIIGGTKVKDKVHVIYNLLKKVDYLLVGGTSASTLLASEGYNVGSSIIDEDFLKNASDIIEKASSKIFLPVDVVVASSLKSRKPQIIDIPQVPTKICSFGSIYDIGPKTIIQWQNIIKTARTIFWSGPLGVFEKTAFSKGTRAIAKSVSSNPNQTVIGGGDTESAISKFRIRKFTHISTSGSAMLDFVAGEDLPGVVGLDIGLDNCKLR
ncbi:phosphoglycerate kinase [bacterium CG10_big_fil_rev_8_21_14_0_10_33_18]|nr:MAG: phosphoglycerate kinase [bacterium CG10_big_fil_rev_8_21_14_0_10_33_18]